MTFPEPERVLCADPDQGQAPANPRNARRLTRFSRFFSPADADTPQRQEAQIVQSQLDL